MLKNLARAGRLPVLVLVVGLVLVALARNLVSVGNVLLGLLALAVGSGTVVMLNRRYRGKLAPADPAAELDNDEVLALAVVRREPRVLAVIGAGDFPEERLTPALRPVARGLRYRAGGLRFKAGEDGSPALAVILPEMAEAGVERAAEIAPPTSLGLPPGLAFSLDRGRVRLEIEGGRGKTGLELDNPAFSYKLRLLSGQVAVICPGDLLQEASGRQLLKFVLPETGS